MVTFNTFVEFCMKFDLVDSENFKVTDIDLVFIATK